jgi:hypothetical protein
LAGAFVCFAAFEVAGRLLGVLGHAGAVAAPASNTFETPTALLVCLMRLIVVLMRLIVVLMRLK